MALIARRRVRLFAAIDEVPVMKYPFAGLLLFLSFSSQAGDLLSFAPGDPIRSSDINANFSELANRGQQLQSIVDVIDARVQVLEGGASVGDGAQSVLMVFTSTQMFQGNAGRKAMNAACAGMDSRARFCSVARIYDAINSVGVDYSGLTARSRLDYPHSNANQNCGSWSSSGTEGSYTIWETGSEVYEGAACSSSLPVACCY